MNIKPEQLQNNLSNQLASIYFVFGVEILLVDQSLSLIKDSAKTKTAPRGVFLLQMQNKLKQVDLKGCFEAVQV